MKTKKTETKPFTRTRKTWKEEAVHWASRPDAMFPEGPARTNHEGTIGLALGRYPTKSLGVAFARIVLALAEYRDVYEARYGVPLTDDDVLGSYFRQAAKFVGALSCGDTGGLDNATLDAIVRVVGGVEGDD